MLEPRLLRASMIPEFGTPGGVDAAVPGLAKPCPPTSVGLPDGTYMPPFHPWLPEFTALIMVAESCGELRRAGLVFFLVICGGHSTD